MPSKNDSNWHQNYEALRAYILERGHLPDKHVVENRALLSWAKYQRKKIKEGTAYSDFSKALKAYILERGHLPDKHVVENRALLNWAKYNRKKIKAGTLDADKVQLFEEHLALRSNEHTGGRKPPHSAAQIAQRLRHSGVKMAEILGVLRYQKSYTAVPSKRN